MEHGSAATFTSYTCDGQQWMDMGKDKTGSWAGHFLPGLALLFWALHWNFGVFKAYLTQSKQAPYRSQTTYPIPFLPDKWPVEAVLKIAIPVFSILTQLWWASGQWRSNMCPEGTARAGHFFVTHIYNYQNAWVLFAFMAAGIIDVLGLLVELPQHTQQFFTASAFALQAFILNKATHMDELESMTYYLLFLVAAGTAVFMLSEIIWPDGFFPSCGRIYCTYIQAIWYFAAARILYEGRPAWQTQEPMPDMAPAMFVPVPFVFWMNVTSFAMLMVFLAMRWWYQAHLNESLKAHCCVERTLVLDEQHTKGLSNGKEAKSAALHELTPLISKGGH